jgi:polyhydroxybutyrate depolymerase
VEQDLRVPAVTLKQGNSYGAGDYVGWLNSGNINRFYEVHVPPQYLRSRELPVVIAMHGGGGFPGTVRYESRLNEVADRHGFIVVYPAGTGSSSNDRLLYWNSGPSRKDPRLHGVDDVKFIASVLDDVAKFFSIDSKRVYATGISNGAQMSFRLASELSNRIAAAAPVSGDRTIGQFFKAPPHPVPIIAFHGMQDSYLPFAGGDTPKNSGFENVVRVPVTESMLGWVQQAGADTTLMHKTQIGHAVCYHYPPGKNGVEVDFWILEDGGHTWPSGLCTRVEERLGVGHINQDISASELMWAFFQRHHL